MKVDVKKLPRGQAEITVELTIEEYQPFLEIAAKKISENVNLKGFRPGKAGFDIIERHVGKNEVWAQAFEPAVMKTLLKALQQENIFTVGQPHVDAIKLAPENPVIYKALVSLLPSVTLGDYSTIKIAKKEIVVDEAKVKKTLNDLRKMHAKETLVNRAAVKGDKIEIDFESFLDQVPLDQGKHERFPLVIGEGAFIPGFEDQLIGMKANDQKTFQLEFPKTYHQKNLAGRLVDFSVTAHNVYELELPELNDNLAKGLGGYETVKQIEDEVRQNLMADATNVENHRIEEELLDKILEISKFEEVPDVLVNTEAQKMLEELNHSVSDRGIRFEDYLLHLKKTSDDLLLEFAPQALKRVKSALVLRAVGEKDKVTISDEELDSELNKTLKLYGGNADAEKKLNTPEYKNYLRNVLASKKIVEHLKSKVVQ